jgi:hypothetical protein
MSINRLIFQGFGLWRWVGGLGGALLGWCLLFGGWQVWRIVEHNVLRPEDLLSPDFFVLNKTVPMLNLFGAAGVSFTASEIEALKRLPFVQSVAPFEYNRFKAHADFGSELALAAIETDLFFEAVPNEYLDGKAEGWHWQPGDTDLPVIISRDYLALYNFGFAQSRNLPRMSEALLRQLRFSVRISGKGKELELRGRIAGFSQRINTILAPAAFIQWANNEYGEGPGTPARLLVKADAAAGPSLVKYLESKNYQFNAEQLRKARIGAALRLAFTAASGFGLAVLGLAFWVFALSLQLIIAQNQDSLRKLVWLGCHPAVLVRRYLAMMGVAIFVIAATGVLFVCWGNHWLVLWLAGQGYPAESVSLWPPVIGMALLGGLLLGFNYLVVRKQIYRLA